MGSASRGEARHACRSDSGRAAGFVAELGPTGFFAGQARQHLTRLGSASGAARRSVANLGFARGAGCSARPSRSGGAASYVGIAGSACNSAVELGLACTGPAAGGTGAFLGRTAAFSGSASRASASSAGARATTTGCRSVFASPFVGRAGCTRAVMGRPGAGWGSATGRAGQTGFPDGALMEPAGSGMGSAQAGGLGALFERVGSAPTGGGRAATDRGTVVGGARRSCRTQVRRLERAGRAGLGHAEDRRAGCTGSALVGRAGRASGRPAGGSSVEPAGGPDPDSGMVDTFGAARTARCRAGAKPHRHGSGRRSRVGRRGSRVRSDALDAALGSSEVQSIAARRG